jgi:ATP-dependent RNA circularization protein (DNA/RNA ligase family)
MVRISKCKGRDLYLNKLFNKPVKYTLIGYICPYITVKIAKQQSIQ